MCVTSCLTSFFNLFLFIKASEENVSVQNKRKKCNYKDNFNDSQGEERFNRIDKF